MNSSFRITEVQQISKNRYLCTIAAEDHFEQDGVYYTRPRRLEIITMVKDGIPSGNFRVVNKLVDTFPHVIVLKKLMGAPAPKCRDVQYIPIHMVTASSITCHRPDEKA